ncbi:MAG: universal stress protein [Caulobacteraceae bacterium]
MDLTDILLPLKPGRDDSAAMGLAARLGRRYGARVRGLCLTPWPPLTAEDSYASGATAVHDVLERMDTDVRVHQARAEDRFRSAMRGTGCEQAWNVTELGELAAETALRARTTDLVVLTRPGAKDATDLPFAECVVRLSGAPCLMVPPAPEPPGPFDHVVVAWNGSRQAKRALDDALPFLKDAARVTLLYIGQAEGAHDLHANLVDHLARKGVHAVTAVAPKGERGPARTLLDWCADNGADLLVMGAFGHTPRAERWLGGATWTVLTTADLPVLMSC